MRTSGVTLFVVVAAITRPVVVIAVVEIFTDPAFCVSDVAATWKLGFV